MLVACNKDDNNNEIPDLGNTATLTEVANSQVLWTGVTISKENRLFACYPRIVSDTVPYSVAEVSGANATPFPDATWNTWKRTLPPQNHFVSVQSVVIDDQNFYGY